MTASSGGRGRDPRRRWPGHATVWRWHFYAALFCMPFVLWLSLTGSIYLFRPQIEAWIDRPYADLAGPGPRAAPAAQAAAAVRAVPGSVLHRYQLPETPGQAVQVIVGSGTRETRVYVHPVTLAILKRVDEDDRLMRIVFRLHGELLAGDAGSYLVELAASWTILMILSGLVLWWPRGQGLAGVVYPRWRAGGRRFWRDLHAVTGLWVSLFALALLLSGLPWAKSWGSYLQMVRTVAEGRVAPQDWSAGHAAELSARGSADAGLRARMAGHAGHGGMTAVRPLASYAPLDRVVARVAPLGLAAPVLIAPPAADAAWSAKSDASDRPRRTELTLDGTSGAVLTRRDFAQRQLLDRIVGYGVAAHEGALFGLANQLLNLLTAAGLALLCISSVVLWWRRRPPGVLGAPPAPARHRLATGFFALVALLGILLPLFGASLIAVLVAERLVLRGTQVRRWMGLGLELGPPREVPVTGIGARPQGGGAPPEP